MAKPDSYTQTASAELWHIIDDQWEFQMREDPLFATTCGDHRYGDRLPAVTPVDYERRLSHLFSFRERLAGIDRAALSPEEQLHHDIFKRLLQNEIGEYEFQAHLMPVDKLNGFHIFFAELPQIAPLDNREDYEKYIARLNGFKAFVDQYIDLMRAGMREGYMPPRIVLDGIQDSIQPHIVKEAGQSIFFKPFERFPNAIDKVAQPRLAEQGRAAIVNSVVPGYRALLAFVAGEYQPAARADIAAAALPNGHAFYEHRIRYFTSLSLTPQQVHGTGLAEGEHFSLGANVG